MLLFNIWIYLTTTKAFDSFGMTECIVEALKCNTNLKGLILDGNKLSESSVSLFCRFLSHSGHLQKIGLRESEMLSSETVRLLIEVPAKNENIVEMNLSEGVLCKDEVGVVVVFCLCTLRANCKFLSCCY